MRRNVLSMNARINKYICKHTHTYIIHTTHVHTQIRIRNTRERYYKVIGDSWKKNKRFTKFLFRIIRHVLPEYNIHISV